MRHEAAASGTAGTSGAGRRVAILMGAYNGARHIREQLDSILMQDHGDWTLTVSDDGSTDGTLEILDAYREQWGPERLAVVRGPRRGFCRNFLSLADREDLAADYFAWADQDDIWLPDKLSRSLALIAPAGQDAPTLYCGRTAIVDEHDVLRGLSPLRSAPPPEFANALVQSLAGGNTMVFNRPARELIRVGCGLDPVSHDWWAYQVVTGSGGLAVYDPRPTVRYRQHGGNAVGSNMSVAGLLSRVRKAWGGTFREMNAKNLSALEAVSDRLTAESRDLLAAFSQLSRGGGRLKAMRIVREHGFYRRSLFQQMSLYFGVFMRRV
ncbi:MAG: glycosyltransferase family 2 protein [Deltaproteobacteria bacterium]|jgi:glycosyltransferase involved in cell wall biosynthesis|nr:glycosyltransferase family 2 protein [Deltaproteobacteria bacterium]